MKQPPQDWNNLLKSSEAGNILKNKDALINLSQSVDAQKFISLLNKQSGGNLQEITQKAKNGDISDLSSLLNELTKDPEGAKVMSDLSEKFPKSE